MRFSPRSRAISVPRNPALLYRLQRTRNLTAYHPRRDERIRVVHEHGCYAEGQ